MGRTESSSSKISDDRRRRAGAVVTVDNFAHRKGVTKAIQKFRQCKERKRTDTAKALRQYKKTMKQQGFQPGQGASRKRQSQRSHDSEPAQQEATTASIQLPATKMVTSTIVDQGGLPTHDEAPPTQKQGTKRKLHKSNPFQKSLKMAEVRQLKSVEVQAQRVEREKERVAKLKERWKRSKLLRQRTSKGQPVMKHVIHDILAKLEREKEQEQKQNHH